MSVRLSVSYAATDGSMPETVEIEWSDMDESAPGVVLVVLDRLLAAPRDRSQPGLAVPPSREQS
jgi:hypothetical protein